MNTADEKNWKLAYEVLGELLDLDEEKRAGHLVGLDLETSVRDRVLTLLQAAATGGPLDHEVVELAAPLFPANGPALRPERMGDWVLGPELGRGGMGVVYQATRRTAGFEQKAALKLLHLGMTDPASIARFEREQQILARLEHPHIAGLIDGGVSPEGTPYLVLQQVDGVPIDRAAKEGGSSALKIVDWILEVCHAVAYAHGNLIVHRDLKPANILVDGDDHVRLLDFGVAKLLGEEASQSANTRILTPGYGAPEQRSGSAITTATDVFGIGAVLYRLLSGQTAPEEAPPPPPPSSTSNALPDLDGDLDNIVLMALRPEPERRYGSVEALAEDLRRWRRNLPVAATPDRLTYRLRKLVQRHRGTVAASLVAVLALLAGSSIALWQATIARQEAQRARTAAADASQHLERAQAVTDFLLSTFLGADPAANESEEVTARDILDAGIERLETNPQMAPEVRRELRSVLGEVSFRLGDLDHTETLLAPNLVAPEDPVTLSQEDIDRRVRDLRFAARAALREGQPEVTEERFAQAIALAAKASLVERLDLEAFYATTLVEMGRAEEALERIEAVASPQAERVASRAQWAGLLSTRATAELRSGRLKGAKASAEEALGFYRSLEGSVLEGHDWIGPRVEQGKTEALLAGIEADLGNLDRAITLGETALATLEPILGSQHPRLLAVRNDLATFLKNQGRFAESASRLEGILGDQSAVLGPDHPFLADTRFNLARALDRAADSAPDLDADLVAALLLYRQCLERALATPKAFGGRLALFEVVYGEALGRAGRFQEAEAQIRSGLDRLGDRPTSSTVAKLRVLYASFLNDRGRHGKAQNLAEQAEKVLSEKQGETNRWHPLAELQLGRSLAPTRPGEAQQLLLGALEALRSGTFHRQYAREIAQGDSELARLDRAGAPQGQPP
ncbi:MAG: serine/threonine-protein kinase [Deltaproteobacteria bacterium]|nr:serine/threonine-protein kinase [Deltaproteobacteria bacterium]